MQITGTTIRMLKPLAFRFVLGRLLVERSLQQLSRRRRRYGTFEYDVLRAYVFSVQVLICVIVCTKSGAGERDSSKQSPSARIGEDLGPQCYVGLGGGGPPNRTRRRPDITPPPHPAEIRRA